MIERRLTPDEIDRWWAERGEWWSKNRHIAQTDNEPRVGGVPDARVPSIKARRGMVGLPPMREGSERLARKRKRARDM